MRPRMSNMEKILHQKTTEKTRAPNKPLWISKKGLKYACGHLKLSEETNKHCNFAISGGNTNGYYRFEKDFSGSSDIPTKIQEKMERTLNYQTPVWLDDIIIVTMGDKDKKRRKMFKIREKLQQAGHRASQKKSDVFSQRNHLAGTRNNRVRNKTEQ